MAQVVVTQTLKEEIFSRFKAESSDILSRFKLLESQPQRGKELGAIGGVVIKELKYKKFRFYFITDGHTLKFGSADELVALIIKFVRMSEKKDQQKRINEVKGILKSLGFDGF